MNSTKRRYDFLGINTLRKPQVFHFDAQKKRWNCGLDCPLNRFNKKAGTWSNGGTSSFSQAEAPDGQLRKHQVRGPSQNSSTRFPWCFWDTHNPRNLQRPALCSVVCLENLVLLERVDMIRLRKWLIIWSRGYAQYSIRIRLRAADVGNNNGCLGFYTIRWLFGARPLRHVCVALDANAQWGLFNIILSDCGWTKSTSQQLGLVVINIAFHPSQVKRICLVMARSQQTRDINKKFKHKHMF